MSSPKHVAVKVESFVCSTTPVPVWKANCATCYGDLMCLGSIPFPPRKKMLLLVYLVCVLDQNRGCPAAVINSVYERHPEMKTTDATTRVDNLPGEFKEWDGSKQC